MTFTRARDLIKDTTPVYAYPSETVLEAVKKMAEHNVGSVPVVDESMRVIGIFTERDLVRLVAKGGRLDAKLEDVMTRKIITASPDDPLPSLASKMLRYGIRHLPIVDSDGRLLGVVSIRRVLQFLLAGSEWP